MRASLTFQPPSTPLSIFTFPFPSPAGVRVLLPTLGQSLHLHSLPLELVFINFHSLSSLFLFGEYFVNFCSQTFVDKTLHVCTMCSVQFSSVAQWCPTLWPHESQHARPPCPAPAPGVYSNPRPSGRWCHPAISSSVVPFSSFPQSLPASGSFPVSQLFVWGGQSIGVSASASVLPMNTQDWSP